MTDSILNSIKKVLGIEPEYKQFDPDIIMFTNATFSTLTQIGIGPSSGFSIEDESATWFSLLFGDERLEFVKSYVALKVRLLFDPPATSFAIAALEKIVAEYEFRISVVRENAVYGNANMVSPSFPSGGVFDGGTPSGEPDPGVVIYDGGKP